MPYSLKFSPEKYSSIEKYIKQLSLLEEEKTLSITLPTPAEAERTRWLLYDYLHHLGTSGDYKVKRIVNYLLIGKTKPLTSNIVTLEERSIDSKLDYYIRKLLQSDKPRELFSRLCLSEEFSFGTLSLLASQYSRIMHQ